MTKRTLEEQDEEVGVLLADGFEKAFIGYVTQFHTMLACYDYDKCVKILMKRDGMNNEEAITYMDYNVASAWLGKYTPCFLRRMNIKDFIKLYGEGSI